MPPEDIVIQLRINDRTQNTLEQVKRDLREIQQLQSGPSGDQASRERIARLRQEQSAESDRSREKIANTRQEQAADTNRSREAVAATRREQNQETTASREKVANIRREQEQESIASREKVANIRAEQNRESIASRESLANIRLEQTAENNRSREAVANTRREQNLDTIASREKIANTKSETDARRLAGQEESRVIQRRRLQEQALARESRERLAQLRLEQSRITRGFQGWTGALQEFAIFMGGSLIQQAFSRFGRHIFEITAEFERLRLGLAALEGNTFIADEQLARLRRLADLPGIGYTQGIRAFTGLRGAGISQDLSIRLYREIANVATLSGATQEDISENLRQFRQIFSARRFTQQDVRPIVQRNPLIQRAFLQEFGSIQAGDINTFLEANNISIEQAFERLVANLEGGPRAAADTLQNSVEILRDAFDDLSRDIGRDLTPLLRDIVRLLTRGVQFARTPAGRVITAGVTGAGVGAIGAAGLGLTGLATGGAAGTVITGAAATALQFGGRQFLSPEQIELARQFAAGPQGRRIPYSAGFRGGYGILRAEGAGRIASLRAGLYSGLAVGGTGRLRFLNRGIPAGAFLGPVIAGATTGIAAQLAQNAVERVISGEDYNAFDQILSVIGGGQFAPVRQRGIDGARGPSVIRASNFGLDDRFSQLANQLGRLGPLASTARSGINDLLEGLGGFSSVQEALSTTGPLSEEFTEYLRELQLEFDPARVLAIRDAFRQFNTLADETAAGYQRRRAEIQRQAQEIFRLGAPNEEGELEFSRRTYDELNESEQERIDLLLEELEALTELENRLQSTIAARRREARLIEEVPDTRSPSEIQQDIRDASREFREGGGGQVGPEGFRGPGTGPLTLTDRTVIPNQFPRAQLPPPGDTRGIILQDYEVDPVTGEARRIGRRSAIPRGRDLVNPGLPQRGGTVFPNLRQGFHPEALNNIFSLRVQELLNRGQRPQFPYVPGLTSIIPQVGPIADITDPLAGIGRTELDRRDPLFGANRLLEGTTSDAGRLRGLVGNVRDLLTEWESVNTEVDRFTNQFEGLSYDRVRDIVDVSLTDNLFTPEALRTAENTRRELEEMSATLERFADDIRTIEGVPQRLQDRLEVAAQQIESDIDRLDGLIEDARALRRDLREQEIDDRIGLTDEELNQLQFGRPTAPSRDELLQDARTAYETLPGVQRARQRERQRARAISGYFEGAGESLYDQFIAPSILDAVGIGSGQSAAQERAIENLTRSIETAREDVRQNELLNERQQAEQLLEINREYENEKREIERSYEEERRDAWANWVRQQLIDFPKLIFQQLNLQLAARATNSILNSLNIGGSVPITGPGIGAQAGSFLQRIGLGGSPGAGVGGGTSVAGVGATVGTAASVALAAHNIITGISSGLYDDIGQDVGNIFSDIQNATGNNEGQRLYADVGLTVDDVRVFSNKQTELRLANRV